VNVRVLTSRASPAANDNAQLRLDLARLLRLKQKLGGEVPAEITEFLGKVGDPETFLDLAAFSLCDSHFIKQKLLETLDIETRFNLFNRHLRMEINVIKLQRKLQGALSDSRISNN
jgi:ATP-dependent Lon protease